MVCGVTKHMGTFYRVRREHPGTLNHPGTFCRETRKRPHGNISIIARSDSSYIWVQCLEDILEGASEIVPQIESWEGMRFPAFLRTEWIFGEDHRMKDALGLGKRDMGDLIHR